MAVSDYQRKNLYVDTILPFRKYAWELSLAEAQKAAATEEAKIKARMDYLDLLNKRQIEMDKIRADYFRDQSKAMNEADAKVVESRAKEQLDRLGAAFAAQRTNADNQTRVSTSNASNQTEIEKAKIYAESNLRSSAIRAQGDQAKLDNAIEREKILNRITNDAGTGQRDAADRDNLIRAGVDLPLDKLRADDPVALRELSGGISTILSEAAANGNTFPAESIAKSVSDLKDPARELQATKAVLNALTSPLDQENFLEALEIMQGTKQSSAGPVDTTPRPGAAGRAGAAYIDPIDSTNIPTPEAQGNYGQEAVIQKDMIGDRYNSTIANIDEQIQGVSNEKEKILREVLGYETPDVINLARQHYQTHFGPKPIDINLPNIDINLRRRAALEALTPREPQGEAVVPPRPGNYSPLGVAAQIPTIRTRPAVPPSPFVGSTSKPSATSPQPLGVAPPVPPAAEALGIVPPGAQPQAQPLGLPMPPVEQMYGLPPVKVPGTPTRQQSGPPSPSKETSKAPSTYHLDQAKGLLERPSKADRLIKYNPIAKQAAAIYAIDRRNEVPLLDTAKKITQTFQGDSDKQNQALVILNYLYMRDKAPVKPPGGKV